MTEGTPLGQAGFYHRQLGDIRVTALHDGILQATFDWATHVDAAEATALYQAAFRAVPPRLAVNTFLLRWAGRTVLVDSGCGGMMGPALGRLADQLAVLGVTLESIDTVLLTHLHPDHVGGLVDAAGAALLPNAELIVHEAEPRYWQDEAVLAAATGDLPAFIQLARSVLHAYRGRVRLVVDGDVLPGVRAVPLPGHTPGHSGWMIRSGAESLLIWGDIVHLHGLQFARPEVGMGFDVDGDLAIATRKQVMDMAATERLLVAGMHVDFPGFGHLVRAASGAGAGYALVPEVWAP